MDLRVLNNERLVQGLLEATARAGVSGSGLVISPMADIDHQRMREYRNEVLRRLNQKVEPKSEPGADS